MHALESSLLTGQWDPNLLSELESCPPAAKLTKDVIDGKFREVLTSPLAQTFFRASELQDKNYQESFSWSLPSVTDEADRERIQIILAVACLHAFVQANWIGPDLDIKPSEVVVDDRNQTAIADELLDVKAVTELAYGGEPAYHLAQHAAFLRLSQLIFALPYQHCTSVPWWQLRTSIIHQQLLDEAVPLPPDALNSLESLLQTLSGEHDLTGRLQLEQGRLDHIFCHDKAASENFLRAARATGLQYELTGALGRRTKFQQKDLSQLVLLAESRKRESSPAEDVLGLADHSRTPVIPPITPDPNLPVSLELNDDTLLEQTEFTSSAPLSRTSQLNHLDPVSQPPLHPLDQCILLSLCLNVRNTSPSHGLTSEQMSPYVARVISHPKNWSVHTMALLLRSRLESTRTRTVERSVLQLQALIDQMPTADSSLPERLLYFHSIPLPSKWDMECELALRFLTLGVVKSALEIFERLEMWEQVVKCWQSMERTDRAIAVVRDLLEGRKEEAENVILRGKNLPSSRRGKLDSIRQAKLWCLLGDLEPDNAVKHYERAWSLSKETSGRAMRSLGGYYFARAEFEKAIPCLQRAVNINPLMSRSWFILGCAYVRLENWEGGRDSFSRCVSIDDEDGESWNNLASMYLRLDSSQNAGLDGNDGEDRSGKATSFSNRMLAFRALKQGLKYSYDNWRMWSNYMVVAVDVGELSEACRALARIVEERSAKIGAECVDEEVLERLVNAVTGVPADPIQAEDDRGRKTNPNEGHGLLRRVLDLFDRTILPRVSSPRIFRAYARLLTWQSRWEDVLKAYQDGYRCGIAGTFEKGETDVEKWREAVNEVEDMIDVLKNFGPRVQGFNWRYQGRSILRTFMGRSKDYEEEAEWSHLIEMQSELRSEE
ncbi:tetratricopeptide repeat domain 27 [Rhizopogon vinicolor AM-OR11-026]|uniref:Tetratricopeptide repeat domain 27 n=1 Tax=Rhizopogon vinicolor AM-OR11-026 TaxID=1314800 RepID=A0A1B7NF03_9AGAM|nr:tetratricopeptide repeat domain 27 [Rhizopogon vinicolor AM-OR11-026]